MCFKLPTISLPKHLAILVKKLLPRHFKNSQIWLHFDVGKGGGNIYWCRVGALEGAGTRRRNGHRGGRQLEVAWLQQWQGRAWPWKADAGVACVKGVALCHPCDQAVK